MELSPHPNFIVYGTHLSEEEKLDWLCLSRTENVGPITFFELLQRFGSAKAALESLPELSTRGGRALRGYNRNQAHREIELLRKQGARLIAKCEPEYPCLLAQLEDAPPLLSVRGQIELLQKPILGIVGSRNASLNGRRFAQKMAQDLSEARFVISSGLARGIDASAHQGSLQGGTIGVIAGGIDSIYPSENKALYEQMYDQGLVVAEAPLGTAPQANHFPRRNRIISGMAQGIIVVEAAFKSGSLITARNALDQGRDVYAVPGSPLDPRSQGTNKLIQDGCYLIQSAQDVLNNLSDVQYRVPAFTFQTLYQSAATYGGAQSLAKLRQEIEEFLDPTPLSIDELVRNCHNSPQGVWQALLELELSGKIQRHPGNKVSKIIAQ